MVELRDMEELSGEYGEGGKPTYHPRMMLKVLFYSCCVGLMSCRRMWDGLKQRADFIFLSGDRAPDFRTLNGFRNRHIAILPKPYARIVLLCLKVGMPDSAHPFSARLRYLYSANRLRPVPILHQLFSDLRPFRFQVGLKFFHRHAIDSSGSPVPHHPAVGPLEVPALDHLLHQPLVLQYGVLSPCRGV